MDEKIKTFCLDKSRFVCMGIASQHQEVGRVAHNSTDFLIIVVLSCLITQNNNNPHKVGFPDLTKLSEIYG